MCVWSLVSQKWKAWLDVEGGMWPIHNLCLPDWSRGRYDLPLDGDSYFFSSRQSYCFLPNFFVESKKLMSFGLLLRLVQMNSRDCRRSYWFQPYFLVSDVIVGLRIWYIYRSLESQAFKWKISVCSLHCSMLTAHDDCFAFIRLVLDRPSLGSQRWYHTKGEMNISWKKLRQESNWRV